MRKITILSLAFCFAIAASAQQHTYRNPIIDRSSPDPTVIRVEDGSFYLYATENTRNMPIYRSENLVDWIQVGTVFNEESRPKWNPKGALWAPDITRIGDKYVLYYAKSEWGGEWECGIGVATADRPEGPFTDHGSIMISKKIGVQNSIDPFPFQENGHIYLFWGSFHGIYVVELTPDGLRIKDGQKPVRVAGNFMEGTNIAKHGKYYYLIGSAGTCCEGAKSTYRVTVGRSKNLFGPYVDKQGRKLLDGYYEVILKGNERVIGPGHNAGLVKDDKGHDWMIYHGFKAEKPEDRRVVFMDRVYWKHGWPVIKGGQPSAQAESPYFGKHAVNRIYYADPAIAFDDGKYYLTGTWANDGFTYMTSDNLKDWTKQGYLLRKGNGVWGAKWFWAPQFFRQDGKWYFFYCAQQHICLASADSPAGPFKQDIIAPLDTTELNIDPFLFVDDDGQAYLFHSRVRDHKQNIFVAKFDLRTEKMDMSTLTQCLDVTMPWENTKNNRAGIITEGPTVLKVNGKYYLFYSANGCDSIDYAIGYAVADSPMGPWTKPKSQPFISREIVGINGTGHGDIFQDKNGKLCYVFHVHYSNDQYPPRQTLIVPLHYRPAENGLVDWYIDKDEIVTPLSW